MDAVNMLERKIRILEERRVPEYKSLVFYGEDDLSGDTKKYQIKFIGAKGGGLAIEVKFAADCEAALKLNGVKMSAYKPVIGEFSTVLIADANYGENLFEVDFVASKPEKITVKLSGYIEEISDESALTQLRKNGKNIICHYDDRLKKAIVYQYDGGLNHIYEEANLSSASLSTAESPDEITLFTVSNDRTLTAKTLNLLSGVISAPTVIERGVRMVSGSLHGGKPACYYIVDNAVKFCTITGGITTAFTGIKNACKIASTPNFNGAVAVIGYDRVATLYVAPPN